MSNEIHTDSDGCEFIFCPFCSGKYHLYDRKMFYSFHYARYEGELTGHRFVCESCCAEMRFPGKTKPDACEAAQELNRIRFYASRRGQALDEINKFFRTWGEPIVTILASILANSTADRICITHMLNNKGLNGDALVAEYLQEKQS